jgi:hypothetical protein
VDIRFQSAAAPADVDLAAYARRCLLLRLQHRSDRVDRFDVEFVDAAGRVPRRDSHCIVRMKLQRLPAATVVDVGVDVSIAIDRAADRAARLAEEQLRQADSSQAPRTEAVAA